VIRKPDVIGAFGSLRMGDNWILNMKHLPIACSLDGRELAARQSELRAGLLAQADVERINDGYRWRFTDAPGLVASLGATIDAERRCCAFLQFHVLAEPGAGSVTLDVTGPPGTPEFLESWLPAR
jgi:hypothetical protein